MEKSKVVLIPCQTYDEEQVYEKIKEGLAMLGGISSFVKQEEALLVKPNLLLGAAPEKAVSTHPSVFGAVLRILKEEGFANVKYGDGPGVGSSNKIAQVVDVSGLKAQAEKYNVPLAEFDEAIAVSFPEGRVAKRFVLAKDAVDADGIISVCKMKTHALENITGALKNQYGCVYKSSKGPGHAKYPNSRAFGEMIADLNAYLKPRLFIMDGIVAMEGNGPGSGDPTPMNVLLMSKDPVALDTVFSYLVYLSPSFVPTTVAGAAIGLGTMNPDYISVLTPEGEITALEAQAKYGNSKFNVVRKKPHFWKLKATLKTLFRSTEKPVADPAKCIACGICEKACPVEGKAVHSGNGQKATYDYTKCIRCYCCQEMCPVGAISRK